MIFLTADVAYSIDWTNSEECESHMYRIKTELNKSRAMESGRRSMSRALCETAKNEYKEDEEVVNMGEGLSTFSGNSKEVLSMLKSVVNQMCDMASFDNNAFQASQINYDNFNIAIGDSTLSPTNTQISSKCEGLASCNETGCDSREMQELLDVLRVFDRVGHWYLHERIPLFTFEEVDKEEEEDESESEAEAGQGSSGGGGGGGSAGGEVLGSRQLPYAVGGAFHGNVIIEKVEEEEKEASQGVR